jgi:hypothetical protein
MTVRALLIGLAGLGLAAAARAPSQAPAPEIVVYASDLATGDLSEFAFWDDPASPGGKLAGTPNHGEDLDPPPENDPHVTFMVPVRGGVPYRCWIHMKVGAPKGTSKANKVFVQFTGAVDQANKETLKPRSASYLTAEAPPKEGWTWVACDPGANVAEPLVRFKNTAEGTVRIQGGAEGVGFDQFLLSPARFLAKAPTEPVVPK